MHSDWYTTMFLNWKCKEEKVQGGKVKTVSSKDTWKSTEVQKQSICAALLPTSGYFFSVTDYSNFNHLINLTSLRVTLYSLNLQCYSRRLTTEHYAVVDIEWFWWFGFSSFGSRCSSELLRKCYERLPVKQTDGLEPVQLFFLLLKHI